MQVLAYTNWGLKGIYALRFDTDTCAVTPIGHVAEAMNPTFFAVHPSRRFLFAVNQLSVYRGERSGAVTAYAINGRTGALEFLNAVPSRGVEPCFISVDGPGRNALVANYMSGSVAVLPVAGDGRLRPASALARHSAPGTDLNRESQSLAHSVNASPGDRFAIAANLGTDELVVYHFDCERGALVPNSPPSFKCRAGSGPRHFAFHRGGRFAYAVNELRSQVTALAWNPGRGTFSEVQNISTVPEDFSGTNFPAEIAVHPGGRFVYASNRGHDSIAVFAVNEADGALAALEYVSTGGAYPRNFALDPTGGYLFAANQNSGTVIIFRVDASTGRLHKTGKSVEVESPVCVRFVRVD